MHPLVILIIGIVTGYLITVIYSKKTHGKRVIVKNKHFHHSFSGLPASQERIMTLYILT